MIAITIAVAIVIGFVGGFLTASFEKLSFTTNVDLSDVAQMFVTLLAVLVIERYISRAATVAQYDRDSLVEQARRTLDVAHDLRSAFVDAYEAGNITPEADRRIVLGCRGLANELEVLESGLSQLNIEPAATALARARDRYYEYKIAVTGNQFPKAPYPIPVFNQAENLYRAFRKEMFSVIHHVNRA